MIECRGVHTRAGAFALGPLDLAVPTGAYCVVLGRSGSGKTLLLETIAGLQPLRAGSIRTARGDISTNAPEARAVGYVPQDAVLFPHLDVGANIAFGPRMAGVRGTALERSVREAARLCAIEHRLEHRPRELSGGERQRVALARAIARGACVLLLDEPLSALDPPARDELREVLRRVHRRLGTTTLHVTHDLDEAAALADRVAVLHRGRLEQFGALDDILRRPATLAVAGLMGDRNLLAGRLETTDALPVLVTAGGLRITAATAPAGARLAVIAADDVLLAREPLEASSVNRFTGRVLRLEARPPLCRVTIDTGAEPLVALVLERSARRLGLAPGAAICAHVKASAVHLL